MADQSGWPMRYRVSLHAVRGEAREFEVLTWLGPEKAVLMATCADGRKFGTANGLYNAQVEKIGPAEKDAAGVVKVGNALHDRMEF